MLRVEEDGPVLHVTLNRPEVRNAINDELIAALTSCFSLMSPYIRAVVLSGEGDAYCAGGDLEWMRKAGGYTQEQNYEDALKVAHLFQAIVECPAVVISKVNGACFGGGCGLVSASDVSVALDTALFAFSEVKLGLIPATISPFVIAKIGHSQARALFTTGEVFDSAYALRIGLVHAVAPATELDQAVEQKLKAVLSAGPRAIAASKKLAQKPPQALEAVARLLAEQRSSDEAKEGIGAFLEKRRPSFSVKR